MAIMNSSKYPQRSSFIACATGGTSFNHTSFFNPSDANSSFSSFSSAGSSTSSPIIEQPLATFAEQPHQQKAGSVPRKRGRKRTKVADPSHIPRPMNCFIQFRRQWVQAHRDTELAKGTKSLSKLAGEAWNQLSKEERDHFMSLAKEAKKKHEEEFPDYRYEPKRKAPKSSSSSSSSKNKRSSSRDSDPDWVPSILRGSDSSTCSERSSQPPSDMYLSTDESDVESLNTPYYSRGSSVDLSYNPEEDVPEASGMVLSYPHFDSFTGLENAIMPPKDDRTPTQANFAFQIHSQMLQAQQNSQNTLSTSSASTYPEFGAASNAHDLATLPQYDNSSFSQTSQSSYQYYHALPLQQVAHSLPSVSEAMAIASSLPSSQGSEPLSFYDEMGFSSTQVSSAASTSTSMDINADTANPVQWDQNTNNDSLYASALDNTTSQFATAAPFSDFLGLSSDFPITPLSRMFFDHEKRTNAGSATSKGIEELQDSFIASLETPPYWAENVQEAFDNGSGWNVPN